MPAKAAAENAEEEPYLALIIISRTQVIALS